MNRNIGAEHLNVTSDRLDTLLENAAYFRLLYILRFVDVDCGSDQRFLE